MRYKFIIILLLRVAVRWVFFLILFNDTKMYFYKYMKTLENSESRSARTEQRISREAKLYGTFTTHLRVRKRIQPAAYYSIQWALLW